MVARRALLLAGVIGGVGLACPAFAQTVPETRHVRGTISSLRGGHLTVRTGSGQDVTVLMSRNTKVASVSRSSLSAVKKGDFIGTAATGPDNHLVAREVTVFPPALRGTNEGHYPWDLGSQSTMTNATVTAEVTQNDGHSLTLAYKGGQSTVVVPPSAPVVAIGPGDRALLQRGAKVFVIAGDQNGTLNARVVVVGKDGLMPPM